MSLKNMAVSMQKVKERANAANNNSGLINPNDPEQTYSNITRAEYDDFKTNYGDFEKTLFSETQSTALIDAAPQDAKDQNELAKAKNKRNLERYGVELTGAQKKSSEREFQRSEQLSVSGNTNNARIAQFEANQNLRSNLANIASGVYGNAMSGLGNASQNAAARNQSYKQNQANFRAQRSSSIGQIGATVAMIAMLSDERMKNNIKLVGKERGHNIYSWDWNIKAKEMGWGFAPTTGVIAQEVRKYMPEAVIKGAHGYLMVNYGVL